MFLNDPNNVYPVNIQTYPKVALTKIELLDRADYTFRHSQTKSKYNEANRSHLVRGRTRLDPLIPDLKSDKKVLEIFRNLSKKTDQNWPIIGERNLMID